MPAPDMENARRPLGGVLSDGELSGIAGVCAHHPYVRALYLFGSRARNEARQGSDFDFYAEMDADKKPSHVAHLTLIDELTSALGKRVDLVCGDVWTARDDVLRREIERDGVLVYDRDAQR